MKGFAGGVTGTALLIGIVALVKKKIDENKKHEKEGKAILNGLEEGLAEFAETNKNVLPEKGTSNSEK